MAIGTAHQLIGYTGVNVTFEAPNTNPVFITTDGTTPGLRSYLWIKNADASSRTVTIATPGFAFEQPLPDIAVAVPSGQERLVGPLHPDLVTPNFPVVGVSCVLWTYSATSNVTIAVVDLPTPPPDLP